MQQPKAPITDTIARYFDLIFSIGFMVEAVWFIVSKPSKMTTFTWICLIIYYIMFAVLMGLSFINNKLLLTFCGFFRGY